MRSVNQYTPSGEFLKTYRSIKDAANSIGASSAEIYNSMNRKTKYKAHSICKGYIWKYAEESKGEDNMIEFNLRNGKDVSLTDEEANVAIKYYDTLIGMLNELEKNPSMISTIKQGMYDAIREIKNAQSKAEEKSAEENTNKKEKNGSMVD